MNSKLSFMYELVSDEYRAYQDRSSVLVVVFRWVPP